MVRYFGIAEAGAENDSVDVMDTKTGAEEVEEVGTTVE